MISSSTRDHSPGNEGMETLRHRFNVHSPSVTRDHSPGNEGMETSSDDGRNSGTSRPAITAPVMRGWKLSLLLEPIPDGRFLA